MRAAISRFRQTRTLSKLQTNIKQIQTKFNKN